MLRTLVKQLISGAPDVQIVELQANSPPDVLLVADEYPTDEGAARERLLGFPRSRLLMLNREGSAGMLWELRPHGIQLGELSREKLLGALRGQLQEDA